MFLESLKLHNFRSFEDECLRFSKDLTILVGENNGGKSNAIDALRLITTPFSKRREIYCESCDIRFGSATPKFELEAVFANLSVAQQGRLISAVTDHTLQRAVFGLCYDESNGNHPVRPSTWAGHLRSVPEAGCQDAIRHVYLPPLRDAKRSLASGNPTRIYALLRHFLGEDDPKELAKRLKRDSNEQILKDIGSAVDVGLTALTGGVRRQSSALGFSTDEALIDIARDLRFKLADHGIEPEDLRYTGHGYANLLYMATIAVELQKATDVDLTLFLLEEPEAHLHPQLQAAVLSFLEEQAEKSKEVAASHYGPAGQLQVIVATHSPNLSAWVSSKNIVFLKSVIGSSNSVSPTPERCETEALLVAPEVVELSSETPKIGSEVWPSPSQSEEPAAGSNGGQSISPNISAPPSSARRSTRCIPLRELALDDADRRKVDRYLDVTKSALLFGGRVLLVEGIAEALLLPIIAKKYVLKGEQEKLRILRSTVFVPIDGVDFEPYLRLLLTPFNDVRIADRVVVITDGDRTDQKSEQITPGEKRQAEHQQLAKELCAVQKLRSVINVYTLETELVAAGNAAVMKQVYLKLHPNSGPKWDEAIGLDGDKRAAAIKKLFEDTPKGDFAQLLAEAISGSASFNVPSYIRTAIEAIVE